PPCSSLFPYTTLFRSLWSGLYSGYPGGNYRCNLCATIDLCRGCLGRGWHLGRHCRGCHYFWDVFGQKESTRDATCLTETRSPKVAGVLYLQRRIQQLPIYGIDLKALANIAMPCIHWRYASQRTRIQSAAPGHPKLGTCPMNRTC